VSEVDDDPDAKDIELPGVDDPAGAASTSRSPPANRPTFLPGISG
jgi:hypothetical protein